MYLNLQQGAWILCWNPEAVFSKITVNTRLNSSFRVTTTEVHNLHVNVHILAQGRDQPPGQPFPRSSNVIKWEGGPRPTPPAATPFCRPCDGGFTETITESIGQWGGKLAGDTQTRGSEQFWVSLWAGSESSPQQFPSLGSPPWAFFPNPMAIFKIPVVPIVWPDSKWIYPRGGYLTLRTEVGWCELLLIWLPEPAHEDDPVQADICKRPSMDINTFQDFFIFLIKGGDGPTNLRYIMTRVLNSHVLSHV